MTKFTKDPSTHPSTGPLTEERLIRVRDELASASKRSDGGNLGYMMADAAKAIDEVLALRKVEQEPVAFAPKGHIDRYLRGDNSGCWVYGHPVSDDDERLYRASQISPFDRRAIASKVQGLCSRLPGATFANAAEFTLDEIEAPTGQEEPVSQSFKFLTLEHIRVIEMLLSVCGAAFELADDSCQQQIDGEDCHIVPDTSFAKLSDTLGEIEDTLPYELPNTILQWAAIPRYALRGILYAAPQLPQPAVPDKLLSAMEEVLRISDRDHDAWHRAREWIADCRAAMLQGAEPVSHPYTLREGVAAIRNSGIAIDAGKIQAERDALNEPDMPDGYAMVPVEPTAEMVAAAMLSNDVLFDQDDDTMFRVQHGVIWRAMLAAAPDFREISNSSTEHFRGNAETSTKCPKCGGRGSYHCPQMLGTVECECTLTAAPQQEVK